MDTNNIIIAGRLTSDPEKRSTQSGKEVTTFTIANNGNNNVLYIKCVSFKALPDDFTQHVKKGSLVAIEGRLGSYTYDDKSGYKRKEYEIIINKALYHQEKGEIK